jgi:hypothetical protein
VFFDVLVCLIRCDVCSNGQVPKHTGTVCRQKDTNVCLEWVIVCFVRNAATGSREEVH